jgi:hypothetical protein
VLAGAKDELEKGFLRGSRLIGENSPEVPVVRKREREVLRLRRVIRFANDSAPLRMTIYLKNREHR